jgi:hypothetical protein
VRSRPWRGHLGAELVYGIPVKIAFIAVLVAAITAALRERKLAA